MAASDSNKVCTRCKCVKPLTEFRLNPRCKSGYDSWCRLCGNAATHESYVKQTTETRLRRRARQNAQYHVEPEPYKAKARARHAQNPAMARLNAQRWQQEHPNERAQIARRTNLRV